MKVIEKIRTMTTEEIAKVIYRHDLYEGEFNSFCKKKLIPDEDGDPQCPYNFENCKECIKEWLESEVEEDG